MKEQDPQINISITNAERIELLVGGSFQLEVNAEGELLDNVSYSSASSCVTVDADGLVRAVSLGKAAVTATYMAGGFISHDTITVEVVEGNGDMPITPDISGDEPSISDVDPYTDVSADEFYANYTPAQSYEDAYYRSLHGFMSGSITVPGQMPRISAYQPTKGGLLIRNTLSRYEDGGNTYVVVDAYGNEALKIYKCGAYITLEEVAAYMYAFGGSSDCLPANYTSKKSGKPSSSIWGEYLRVNHSYFKGDTESYPYEPELPNISGCGGSLQYYEMDIGTTGTVTPSTTSGAYNNGKKIIRGAARLVYGRCDLNGNGAYDEGELYVFYTYNHYNDFMEYLNYYGGWGETFGNTTGGGVFDSDTQYNPTPYVPTYRGTLSEGETAVRYLYFDEKKYISTVLMFSFPINA